MSVARIRTIKHEFFYSEQITSVSMAARVFFIGLWTLCDREGRFKWAPRKIKAQLFPYDDVNVSALAEELADAGLMHIYAADDELCAWIPGFTKHQRPHPKEPASTVPVCPADHDTKDIPWRSDARKSANPVTKPFNSTASTACIPPSPVGMDKWIKGMDKGKGTENGSAAPAPPKPVSPVRPLISRRDLTAFAEGPIFSIPQKWVDRQIRASNKRLDDAKMTRFARDVMAKAEREGTDLSRVNLLNWLDGELREWLLDEADREQSEREIARTKQWLADMDQACKEAAGG